MIERAVSLSEVGPTKTAQRRTVSLLGPLAQDLAEWRLASGRPEADTLVFPGHDGAPWTLTAYQNWRRRIFGPAAEACGVHGGRPYDLRHSFVSLLIHEGRNVVEVARQAGHSPKLALDTYAHVFDEFAIEDRLSAEEQIRRVRSDEHVPVSYLDSSKNPEPGEKGLQTKGGRSWIRTRDLFLIREAL